MQPEDLNRWYVRNKDGGMVPFSAFGTGNGHTVRRSWCASTASRRTRSRARPRRDSSSGEAMDAMEDIVAKLPAGTGLEWNGLSYEEKKSGSQAPLLYALSLAIVFLCLAALYESWSIPATVLLVVPLGVLGAVIATLSRGLTNDAYFQVGLLVTIGLAAKSAILIVEFAKENFDHGMRLVESVMQATKQRLRPILMTSLAFMSGVLPLAIASGAGSGAQHAVGTGVIGGMLAVDVPRGVLRAGVLRRDPALFKVKPVTMKVDETPADVPYAGAHDARRCSNGRRDCRSCRRRSSACTLAPRYRSRRRRYRARTSTPTSRAAAGPRPPRRSAGRNSFRIPSCRSCWRARSRTTATCASPRSMSRPRARSTASSVPISCRPSMPRVSLTISARRRPCHRPGESELTRTYSAGFGVQPFELDLFGRVRSLRRAALEDYFRLEETRTAAQLVLVSEVANAWLTLIADRELLALARETRDSQRKSYDLTKLRFEAGVSSEIELHRSETAWREAEVDIAQQTRRVAQDRNALALLVGEPLPRARSPTVHAIDAQTFSKTLPAGLPAELLVRRPDVRAAEHALKAANADIGAARAAFFPSIELTGFYGQASNDLSALFQSGHTSLEFHAAGAPADLLRRREPRPGWTSPTCASASKSRTTSNPSRSRSVKWPMRWWRAPRSPISCVRRKR